MTSVVGTSPSDRLLRPVKGAGCQMIPSMTLTSESNGDDDNSKSGLSKLYEIVVPASAPDSPHTSFISIDGFFHTGVVFEEVENGLFVFRGRGDDWLKTPGGFCDTK